VTRVRRRLALGLLAAPVALILAGCGGDHSVETPSAPPSSSSLPPGFTRGPARAPTVLAVARLPHIQLRDLHRAPLPRAHLKAVTTALVDQPLKTSVRALLVNRATLAPGHKIQVVAGDLSLVTSHDAIFILAGPAFRGQRLVQVESGIAAGTVSLPVHMSPGTWAIGVEDLSEVTGGQGGAVSGQVLLDLGIFTVS
jgi:hypothetical protein